MLIGFRSAQIDDQFIPCWVLNCAILTAEERMDREKRFAKRRKCNSGSLNTRTTPPSNFEIAILPSDRAQVNC
jgi:hypothetical protein